MAEMTPEQEALTEQAKAITGAIKEVEAALEEKRRESVQVMKDMREKGMSWAAVGRAFGVTPQAAMYATGSSVRTPKKGRRQESEED